MLPESPLMAHVSEEMPSLDLFYICNMETIMTSILTILSLPLLERSNELAYVMHSNALQMRSVCVDYYLHLLLGLQLANLH
jgi:hypothetical protein